MDADNAFGAPPGYRFEDLAADGYLIGHRYAGVEFGMAILLADRIAWRYVGVLHEYVTADTPHKIVPLSGPWVTMFHEGARSRDPQTYLKDAALLEKALAQEPANARYAYYLAQSYKDAGEPARALAAYRHRATMPGWDEETWHARYQAALLVERLGGTPADVAHAYLETWNARPVRAEPLVQLARWHRSRGSGRWRSSTRARRSPRPGRPTSSSSRTPSTRGGRSTSSRSPPGTPAPGTRGAWRRSGSSPSSAFRPRSASASSAIGRGTRKGGSSAAGRNPRL